MLRNGDPGGQSLNYYYNKVGRELPVHVALERDREVDLAIVGGGIAGVSAAYHAARKGLSVALLDRAQVASGASGVNGGAIVPNTAPSGDMLRRAYGEERVRGFLDIAALARDYTVSLAEDLHIDCDLRRGSIQPVRTEKQFALLRRGVEELKNDYGQTHLRILDKSEVRSFVATDAYEGGMLNPLTPHLQPLKLTLGLATAAVEAGAAIHERTNVVSVGDGEEHVALRTAGGSVVRARQVLLACNQGNGAFDAGLRKRYIGVYFGMIGTAPLPDGLRPILDSSLAVGEAQPGAAYRLTPDGHLLFGGGQLVADNPDRARRALRKALLKLFPQLADVDIPYLWGGRVAMGRYFDLPDVGSLSPRIHYVQTMGFSWGALFGRIFAEELIGTSDQFRFLQSFPKKNMPAPRILERVANGTRSLAGTIAGL